MVDPLGRRIYGIETEYGVTCTFRGQRRLSPDEVARYLFRRVVAWGRSSNVFLRNGARLYLDVGSHPEYATGECDDLRELVIHDRAGERIVEGLVADAQRRLGEEGIEGEIYLFKNNTDSAGNSYGCHENYLVGRMGEFSRISDALIPFLVTRQLIAGAGKVLATPRGTTFCLSQRAEHIWEGVSSATTRSRPIINTRDEPHADAERYRRLHVIVGDSNMSQTTTLLKVGSADLVLRMLESGCPDARPHPGEPDPRDPGDQPRPDGVAHGAAGQRPDALGVGDPDGLPRIGCSASPRRSGLAEVPIYARVLELWRRTLTAVSTDDLVAVDTEIDWVIKHRLLQRYIDRHDLSWSSPRIAQLDLAYHDMSRERGLFNLLEAADGGNRGLGHRGVRGQVHPATDDPRPAAWGVHHCRSSCPP